MVPKLPLDTELHTKFSSGQNSEQQTNNTKNMYNLIKKLKEQRAQKKEKKKQQQKQPFNPKQSASANQDEIAISKKHLFATNKS